MILLDTHIWVRWLTSSDLKPDIISLIENTEEIAVSAISCWEVAYLVKHNRMKLPIPIERWVEIGLYTAQISCLPIDEQIALLSANLPDHHRDPADRIIIATAIKYGSKIISLDANFQLYEQLSGLIIPS